MEQQVATCWRVMAVVVDLPVALNVRHEDQMIHQAALCEAVDLEGLQADTLATPTPVLLLAQLLRTVQLPDGAIIEGRHFPWHQALNRRAVLRVHDVSEECDFRFHLNILGALPLWKVDHIVGDRKLPTILRPQPLLPRLRGCGSLPLRHVKRKAICSFWKNLLRQGIGLGRIEGKDSGWHGRRRVPRTSFGRSFSRLLHVPCDVSSNAQAHASVPMLQPCGNPDHANRLKTVAEFLECDVATRIRIQGLNQQARVLGSVHFETHRPQLRVTNFTSPVLQAAIDRPLPWVALRRCRLHAAPCS
mmetsp:Transcript_98809/g.247690  ORF Transcript_98809/g.247690 Transcript_98809/m.247690 type:complete len:303 (-) Transcript_98809:122-1030(-)